MYVYIANFNALTLRKTYKMETYDKNCMHITAACYENRYCVICTMNIEIYSLYFVIEYYGVFF